MAFILIVFSLFVTCEDPNRTESDPNTVYNVSFEANGGNPIPGNQTVNRGDKVDEPAAMTNIGYGFGGWYKEIGCTNLWNFATDIITGDITLYAKWDTNYYTVIFNANNGNSAPNQQNIAHNGKVIEPSAMNKTDYTFIGWYKESDYISQWDFATDTVTGNIILYAKWLENFTVTFESNGGTPGPVQQIIIIGYKVSEPLTISKVGFNFDGWYKESTYINLWDFDDDVVMGNTILYAKWGPSILVPGANYNMKIRWLEDNAKSNSDYIIEFDTAQSIGSATLLYSGRNNITISLKGIGSNPIPINAISGSMFIIESGVTLILSENLELLGRSGNTASLIRVNSGGNFIMNSGTRIADNTYSITNNSIYSDGYSQGGGVYIANNGTFTMNGGEIFGNTANSASRTVHSYGGGVYITNGTFIMNDGKITGNTANFSSNSSSSSSCGGGVFVADNGIFTMNGGEISNNATLSSTDYSSYGGGVYITNGTFTMNNGKIYGNTGNEVYINSGNFIMNGGEISGNLASSSTRGVYINGGTFTMSGGKISGYINSSLSSYVGNAGGGVYISSGTFIMSGGEIFGNSSSSYGGGVYVSSFGNFSMSNGEIYGNTSLLSGGGVYVDSSVFNKTGGTIFGYLDGNSKSNVVQNSSGVLQLNKGHAIHAYHSNSIYRMGKDTTSEPSNNLTFNGKVASPTWSGEWDY